MASKRQRIGVVVNLPAVGVAAEAEAGGSSTNTSTAIIRSPARARSPTAMSQLRQFLEGRNWEEARVRALSHPCEVRDGPDPSPLALACRYGAPYDCVQAIMDAAPDKVRCALDSRGTPLHEAMVCEEAGVDVLAALIQADERLGKDRDTPRATLLQDVDGFTPLHLLIRRRFQFHMLQPDDSALLQILEMLVSSCPEAVVVPDRGEYEEPPIVYAIKANIYAPSLGSEDETVSRVERKIYEMVHCMVRHYPQAASQVFTGYRGQYTALHSAVFHGRCTDTIRLILETEAAHPSEPLPALLGNTQGEVPLHFCVMRGERPKSVDLIARAAPQAVRTRDASGLTPFHWLWIRFVSSLLALDDGGRGGDTILQFVDPYAPELNRYVEYWSLEQNDFDLDLHLIRRMDPPVDFLRMRHIPPEVQDDDASFQYAARVFDVLNRLRETHTSRITAEGTVWTRQDVITSLFWNKVVSLLEALQEVAGDGGPRGTSILVHTAFAASCCVPAVAWVAAVLFPQELRLPDDQGRLPLHYAAARCWNIWDWPRDDGLNEPTAARLIQHEALGILQTAIDLSGPEAARVTDHDRRLALHHAVETFVHACTCSTRNPAAATTEMIQSLSRLVDLYPESLMRRDGVSKLFPFLQATAVATELQDQLHPQEVLPLSMTFLLLRQNPTILSRL